MTVKSDRAVLARLSNRLVALVLGFFFFFFFFLHFQVSPNMFSNILGQLGAKTKI